MQISVEDNGIGMNEEEKDNLFKLFETKQDDSRGIGLGLCISKMIIE